MRRFNSLSRAPLDVASSWQFPHHVVRMTEIIAVTNKNFSLIKNPAQRASLHSKQDTLHNQGLHVGLHKQQQLAESHKKKGSNAPKLPRGLRHRPSSFLLEKAHDGDLFVGSAGRSCPFLQVLPFFLWLSLGGQHGLFVWSWCLGLGEFIFAVRAGFALVNLLSHWWKEEGREQRMMMVKPSSYQRTPHRSLPTALLERNILGSRSTCQTQKLSPLLKVKQ